LQEYQSAAQKHIAQLQGELARITTSRSWRWTRPLRGALVVGRASPRLVLSAWQLVRSGPAGWRHAWMVLRRSGLRAIVGHARSVMQVLPVSAAASPAVAPPVPLALPTPDSPLISVVIHSTGRHDALRACLVALAEHPSGAPMEVFVADEGATPADAALASVSGVRFVRGADPARRLHCLKEAAEAARGEFLLMLSERNRVTAHAIEALLGTFYAHSDAGVVGARVLTTDGLLHAAGRIVGQDGEVTDLGRFEPAYDPRYGFLRDADAVCRAGSMIRRSLWERLDGFDERYASEAWADADFAFRAREAGFRVLYQPHANLHLDTSAASSQPVGPGEQSAHDEDRQRFRQRWQAALASCASRDASTARAAIRTRRKSILALASTVPTLGDADPARRLLDLLRTIRADGHHVVLLPLDFSDRLPGRGTLEALGIEVTYRPWTTSVADFLAVRGGEFDAILTCEADILAVHLESIRRHAASARVLLDTADRLRGTTPVKQPGGRMSLPAPAADGVSAEDVALMGRVEAVLVGSAAERERLLQLCPATTVEVVTPAALSTGPITGHGNRRGAALFVDGADPQSVAAVEWYATQVLPHLRTLAPGFVATVVGRGLPAETAQHVCAELRLLPAEADDSAVLDHVRAVVLPISAGDAIERSLTRGVPVVARTTAVDELPASERGDLLIADQGLDFARAIAALDGDANLWARISIRFRQATHRRQAATRAALRSILQDTAAPPLDPPADAAITQELAAEFPAAARLFPERLKSPWWIGHIPFAFELVRRLRPATVVELGTYSGSSFAAFCQAIEAESIDGRAYGVDLWAGDEHMGRFEEALFQEMSRFARERYPNIAHLLRKSFDDAVEDFADGSIDLLHIDGTHTYEAVRNDFERWRCKVSRRGVVLFHDIHVTVQNAGPSALRFGVRRLFDEVKANFRHTEFLHCFGLGVLLVGTEVPSPVRELIERCSAPEVQAFFAALGQRVSDHYLALGEAPPAHAEYGAPAAL